MILVNFGGGKMSVCTFFGHGDCPDHIKPLLRQVVCELIEQKGVTMFYVGNHGAFDRMARAVLRELEGCYPIRYAVVLAYLPKPGQEQVFSDTIFPEGIERVPKRFAITWRNRWMLHQSVFVVSYITHDWGGAAQFVRQAHRQEKQVINLAHRSPAGG